MVMSLLLPAGSSGDPDHRQGSATIIADLTVGAGERDNRQLTDYLDSLGLQRSSSVGVHHTRLGWAALLRQGHRRHERQRRYRPATASSANGFDAAKDLALQALAGLDDDPRHKLMIKLREWAWPSPFGRNTLGEKEHLEKLTLEEAKKDYTQRYHANGAIFSFAGKIDFDQLKNEVARYFGSLPTRESMPVKTGRLRGNITSRSRRASRRTSGSPIRR